MKQSLLFCILFILSQCGYSRTTDTTGLISVTVHLVGEGESKSPNYKEWGPGFFTMATITNNQDTAIRFWVMSCGWPQDNWMTSNDSAYLLGHGCDMNSPDIIQLLPHQSINFYGLLMRSRKRPGGKMVKLGFKYYSRNWDLLDPTGKKGNVNNYKVFWSNEVELRDNMATYSR